VILKNEIPGSIGILYVEFSFEIAAIMAKIKENGILRIVVRKFYFIAFAFLFSGCVENSEMVDNTAIPPEDTILPGKVIDLDKTNFSAMTAIAGRVAMIEFYSPDCGACQSMNSAVTNIALQYKDKALIGMVNVLEDDTLQYAFAIEYWPTFIFLKEGCEARRIVGNNQEDLLVTIMDSLLIKKAQ
jgi:thioredoxin 1